MYGTGLAVLLRPARLRAAPSTVMPFLTGLVLADETSPWRICAWIAVGTMLHACICRLNNVADYESDLLNVQRSKEPLIRGFVTIANVRTWALLELLILASWPLGLTEGVSRALWLAELVLISWGNIFQKRSRVDPRAVDLIYGITMALPALVASGGLVSMKSLGFFGMATFGYAFLNVTAGNLKDIQYDRLAGDRTSALACGVRLDGEAGTPLFPSRYRALVWCLTGTFLTSFLVWALAESLNALLIAGMAAAFLIVDLRARLGSQVALLPFAKPADPRYYTQGLSFLLVLVSTWMPLLFGICSRFMQ